MTLVIVYWLAMVLVMLGAVDAAVNMHWLASGGLLVVATIIAQASSEAFHKALTERKKG